MKKYIYFFILILVLIFVPTKVDADTQVWKVINDDSGFSTFAAAITHVKNNHVTNAIIECVGDTTESEYLEIPEGVSAVINAKNRRILGISNSGETVRLNNAIIRNDSTHIAIYNASNSKLVLENVDGSSLVQVQKTSDTGLTIVFNRGNLEMLGGSYEAALGIGFFAYNTGKLRLNLESIYDTNRDNANQGSIFWNSGGIINGKVGNIDTDSCLVQNRNNGTIDLTGNATIRENLSDFVAVGNYSGTVDLNMNVKTTEELCLISNYDVLNINGGKYTTSDSASDGYYHLITNRGTLNIKDGEFESPVGIVWNKLGASSSDTVTTNITGGTFKVTETGDREGAYLAFVNASPAEGVTGKTAVINYSNATTDLAAGGRAHFQNSNEGTINIGEGSKFLVSGVSHDVILSGDSGTVKITESSSSSTTSKSDPSTPTATKTSSVVEDSNETNPNTSDTKIFLLSVLSVFIIFIGTISYRKFRLIK